MDGRMNTIGINHNLDRARIKKLLSIGLFASILTGIGDFLLGYAEEIPGGNFASGVMAGPGTALGAAFGTMFLSFGNAFMFGGLLATLPDQETFDKFQEGYPVPKSI